MQINNLSKDKRKTLIAGAGEAGSMLLSEFSRQGNQDAIIGFVDDDTGKFGSDIYGKKILGKISAIRTVIEDYGVERVIVALPSVDLHIINSIVSSILKHDPSIDIHILPSVEKYFDKSPFIPSLQEFNFSDIFGREEYNIDIEQIKDRFEGKTILITGAGGSIGSEICRQMLRFRIDKLIAIGRGENSIYNLAKEMNEYCSLIEDVPPVIYRIIDVKDSVLLENAFKEFKPDIVFHAAAHKHVPLMELNEVEAVQNNVKGTLNVLEASSRASVSQFVLVSTDKAVRPVNIMGATKRLCELLTGFYQRHWGIKTSIVRFGNVIGSRGSVIPLFRGQIEKGGPVTVTHPDVTRYFMTIPEASLLVINSAAISNGGEIFVLDMGRQFKIDDIARKLIELYGHVPEKDIQIEYTGLRPGEKLYEELFYDRSHLENTGNNKIFVLRSDTMNLSVSRYNELVNERLLNVNKMSPVQVREMIKDLVPEYDYTGWEYSLSEERKMVN